MSSNDLTSKDIAYMETNRPHLYILTPCYGNQCTLNYMTCMISTLEALPKWGIEVKVKFCKNDSLITRARNNLLAMAMADQRTTHVMFIDSDISWAPYDIVKLIVSDKALIGGIYPLKRYHWSKMLDGKERIKSGGDLKGNPDARTESTIQNIISHKTDSDILSSMTDENIMRCNLVNYNVNYMNSEMTITNNIAAVRHIPTGFMMIQRRTIELMHESSSHAKYIDDVGLLNDAENHFAYALFNCAVEGGHYLSEDWYFCNRWAELGGTVNVDISINLTHTGVEDFVGCYTSSIIIA
jgi:hypothetical protein